MCTSKRNERNKDSVHEAKSVRFHEPVKKEKLGKTTNHLKRKRKERDPCYLRFMNSIDVLCSAQEILPLENAGNKIFHKLIDKRIISYEKADDFDKYLISFEMIRDVENYNPSVRFLQKEAETNEWHELDRQSACNKIMHRFNLAINRKSVGAKIKRLENLRGSMIKVRAAA